MQRGVSERRACRLLDLSRSVRRYRAQKNDEPALVERIRKIATEHPRYGCPRIWAMLRREAWSINHKRVHRMWKRLRLQVTRPKRKRLRTGRGLPLKAEYPNHVWCWDFVQDRTMDRRVLKCLTLSDEFTREGLAIQTGRRLTASEAIGMLEWVMQTRGTPKYLRSDNGPEF